MTRTIERVPDWSDEADITAEPWTPEDACLLGLPVGMQEHTGPTNGRRATRFTLPTKKKAA